MSDSTPQYERIQAGAIIAGDRVARARTHDFREVADVRDPGGVSIWIVYVNGSRDRPGRTAMWWREVR